MSAATINDVSKLGPLWTGELIHKVQSTRNSIAASLSLLKPDGAFAKQHQMVLDVADRMLVAATGWISVSDRLPEVGDYSVLAFWSINGGFDMVHVEQYFAPITNGIGADGEHLMTKWYLAAGVTHWMPLPPTPGSAA